MLTQIVDSVLKTFNKADECPLNSKEATEMLAETKVTSKRVLRLEKVVVLSMLVIIGINYNTIEQLPTNKMMEKVKIANMTYCLEDDERVKHRLLWLIRKEIPFYPEEGLCGSDKATKQYINMYLQGY